MFIVIRKDAKLSTKTNFIIRLLNRNSSCNFFYVFKIESDKFTEKWCDDHVHLSSSIIGVLIWHLLMFLRSPEEFRKGIMRRLSSTKPKLVLAESGFLSTLRRSLYLYFGSSARASRLMRLLENLDSPKFFLIDEFISLKCLDLKKLKLLGPIIYVSQDIAYNHFGFSENFIARKLMFRLEKDAIENVDLVIACSEMERLKYIEMYAKNAIFYPNIYPTKEFEPSEKDATPIYP